MELPEQLNQASVGAFLESLRPLLQTDRPRIVLDCSQVQHMDSAGVEMLLLCLEEAMKRDGDLKLAAVSPASAIVLELMRVDRLFEAFETADAATKSFQALGTPVAPQTAPWYSTAYRFTDLKATS
jgi:anti-sigma B factor antagonist